MIDKLLHRASLLARLPQMVVGITRISSPLYFIALDSGLRHNPRVDLRVTVEVWQV